MRDDRQINRLSSKLNYKIADNPSDFIFNIHAVQHRCWSIMTEHLNLSQPSLPTIYTDARVITSETIPIPNGYPNFAVFEQ